MFSVSRVVMDVVKTHWKQSRSFADKFKAKIALLLRFPAKFTHFRAVLKQLSTSVLTRRHEPYGEDTYQTTIRVLEFKRLVTVFSDLTSSTSSKIDSLFKKQIDAIGNETDSVVSEQ